MVSWLRKKKLHFFTKVVNKSLNPVTTIEKLAFGLDDDIILDLIEECVYKEPDLYEGLKWAEIAIYASKLKGSAFSMAAALIAKGITLIKISTVENENFEQSAKERIDLALQNFKDSITISREINNQFLLSYSYKNVAFCYEKKNNYLNVFINWINHIYYESLLESFTETHQDSIQHLFDIVLELKEEDDRKEAALTLTKYEADFTNHVFPKLDFKSKNYLSSIFGILFSVVNNADKSKLYWQLAYDGTQSFRTSRDLLFLAYEFLDEINMVRFGEKMLTFPHQKMPDAYAIIMRILAFGYELQGDMKASAKTYHIASNLFFENKIANVNKATHEYNAEVCLIRAGELEEKCGKYKVAIESYQTAFNFEGSYSPLVGFHVCLRLAVLYYKLGKYSEAIKYADKLIDRSFVLYSMSFRLFALVFSGQIDFQIGLYEDCFEKILLAYQIVNKHDVTSSTYDIHENFGTYNVLIIPALEIIISLAIASSVKLKDVSHTNIFWLKFSKLKTEDFSMKYPKNRSISNEDYEFYHSIHFFSIGDIFSIGDKKSIINLDLSKEIILQSIPLISDSEVKAQLFNIIFYILYIESDFNSLKSILNKELNYLSKFPNIFYKVKCYKLLGFIDIQQGNYQSAYSNLSQSTELIEMIRNSSNSIEHRISVLKVFQASYHLNIYVCLKLGKSKKAFDFLEKMKARTLLDITMIDNKDSLDFDAIFKLKGISSKKQKYRNLLLIFNDEEQQKMRNYEKTIKYTWLQKKIDDTTCEHEKEILHLMNGSGLMNTYSILKIKEVDEGKMIQLNQSSIKLINQANVLSFEEIKILCKR